MRSLRVGSGSVRIVERGWNQVPPVAGVAGFRKCRQREREIAVTSLVALAYLRHEPVVGRHAVDVKLPSSSGDADDPLTRRALVDDELVMIEEALRGSGHA